MLMKLITLISAMTLIPLNSYSVSEEDIITHLITIQNRNQELLVLISRKTFQMTLRMFLQN